MQFTVGSIVEGKVSKIMDFGAFVDIDGGGSGMVHISEVANSYIKNINEYLKVGDPVKAKIVSINEQNKIALSIKALLPVPEKKGNSRPMNKSNRGGNNTYVYTPRSNDPPSTGDNFEDMMNRFKRSSDDRMSDLSRVIDTRRGSNNRRAKK